MPYDDWKSDQLRREAGDKPMTKHYDIMHPTADYRVGFINLRHLGWFFVSNVSNHQGSRKGHATAEKAFPAWAKKMGCKMIPRASQ